MTFASRNTLTLALGHGARAASRLRGSGGSAFPGLVMEKADPHFMARALAPLPYGVVLVSGTNGKTTTTRMVVELLRGQGLKVFTNPTGSNFTRGVVAALLGAMPLNGRLDADVAVLELDEAHATHFVRTVKPRAALLLNVMRDQLDRFGEIDYTASLLHKVARATTGTVVLNADDPRLAAPSFRADLRADVRGFAVSPQLRSVFLSDDELHDSLDGCTLGQPKKDAEAKADTKAEPTTEAPLDSVKEPGQGEPDTADSPAKPAEKLAQPLEIVATLEEMMGRHAVIDLAGHRHEVDFAIPGAHNILNATAAMGLVKELLGERTDEQALAASAAKVTAAFGRGELLSIDGQEVELGLVKNPAGFRMSLLSAAAVRSQQPPLIMIAINDQYADGRDMSWLWDVDFTPLKQAGVSIVTGVRATDMALRLSYDDVAVGKVEADLSQALAQLVKLSREQHRPIRILSTYTAMLELRSLLASYTDVEEVL
jgi:possible UDP-N-acetylmuramoylalanyl-D-glutamate--2, 6-diaminopimelate ligase